MWTNRTLATAILAGFVLAANGCTTYYQVKDPQTDRTYYTTDLKQRGSGAVTLKDGRTGEEVTIQNSQVREISKEKYATDRHLSGRDLESEARAAEQKAAEEQAAAAQREAMARAAEQRAAEKQAADARADEVRAAAREQEAKAAEARAKTAESEAALAGSAVGAAAAKHAESIEQLRTDLVAGREQVDRTLTSLSQLTDPNQSDLTAAYKRYGEQVDRMNSYAQKIKTEADAMRQAREAYFAKWDSRLAATENPTIRAEAETRRARLRASQEKIAADAALAREAYQPFITALEDTRKFVGTDQSKEAVSVLSPTVKKAQQDGAVLKERIDTVIADLDAVSGKPATRPSTPAARQEPPVAAPPR